MADTFFPPLSSLISRDQLPDNLNFVSGTLDTLLSRVCYRNLQKKSVLANSLTSYDLDLIVFNEALKLDIPGTGLKLSLNPDFENPGHSYSVIPISFSWSWPIIQYIKDFKITDFSSGPAAFYDLIFQIAKIPENDLLLFATYGFISSDDPLDQFVVDANEKYPDLDIPYPLNPDPAIAVAETVQAIQGYTGTSLAEILFHDYILVAEDLQDSLRRIEQLFYPFLGDHAIDKVKTLLIPNVKATVHLSAGLEIPRSALVPIKADGTLETDENIKTSLLFEAGDFYFDSKQGFGFDESLSLSFPASHPKAQIANTGLVIGFTNAKLDVSRTKNIPEADAAGYPVDFVGLYVKQATIGFKKFGEENADKPSAAIIGDNLLIGTGGISGVVALESNGLLHRKFGNFDVELNKFALTFKQNSIVESDIKGKLTIGRFKQGNVPAVIDIEAHIKDNGNFSITAAAQTQPLKITLPNVLELEVRSLSLGKEERGFYVEVAGKLNFIANIPGLGKVLPKGVDIQKLRIWSNGDLEFEGGGLVVPKSFRLAVGPVKLEVTNISLGAYTRKHNDIERKYRYFGFDGMINTGRAGVNATGNGIKYYFTVDDNDQDKPFDSFASIDGIAIDLTVPGNASKDNAAFILNGYLSMNNPDPKISGSNAGSEYTGSVAFAMPRLKLAGSAGMRMNPNIPAFVVDIGLDLSTPIPLGATGLGIYGFRGLIGQHYLPSKSATTPPTVDTASWWDYYKAKSTLTGKEGIEIDKFASKPGYSVGAGISIATAFDSGKIFSSKLFLLLGLPDVFLIQGQAGILRSRIGLNDDVDPPFSAFIAIDSNSFRGNIGVNYRLPEGGSFDGDLFSLSGNLDMAFYFNNSSGWYLNVGKDQPESERVRARILSLFQGYAYLMISSRGFKAGAGARFDFNKRFGPVGVGLGAFVNLGGSISFKPVQIGGFIQFGGYAYLKIFFIRLGLSVQIGLAVEAPHPFNISGSLEIKIKLPWPIKNIKFRFEVSWRFNNNKGPLLQPLPVLQLPDPAKGYLPAVATNILSNETFPVNYVNQEMTGGNLVIPAPGDGRWQYNFNDAESVLNVTVPMDSFIDIELLKPVKPELLKLGGSANQLPDGYSELMPPQKGLGDQVRHEFQLSGLEIFAWKSTGSGIGSWQPYHVYEAVTAIVSENTGSNAIDLSTLKDGFWQFTEPNKYNKIRLLSQNMFSYANQSTNASSDLDGLNFRRKDLFCFENITKETVIHWKDLTAGSSYTRDAMFNGELFAFSQLSASIVLNTVSGSNALSMKTNGGSLTIVLSKPVSTLNLDFGPNENDIQIDYVKTVSRPGFFGQPRKRDLYRTPAFLSGTEQNKRITYNDLSQPIDKVILRFAKDKALDFDGDLVLGGHFTLPDQFITAGPLPARHLEEGDKALMFATLFNRSFTAEEVRSESYSNKSGAVSQWALNNTLDRKGNQPGIISGSPDMIPGFYEKDGNQIESLNYVYSFAAKTDAFHVPFSPELKVETGSFAFEITPVFNPFLSGITTLLQKVNEDPITGHRKGFALHLYQDTPGKTGLSYTSGTVPVFKICLTCYDGTAVSGTFATEAYSVDCLTGHLSEKQYKHILVSVNRTTGKMEIFIDKVLKVSADIPAELKPYQGFTGKTYLNQVSYLSEVLQRRQEENGLTKEGLINEVKILGDGLSKTIQPVWRPDTTYAVAVKTRDVVNGNISGSQEKTHVFGFRTAGPIGHFQQQSKGFKELEAQDRGSEFKLANLKHYIDYERSFPDAQSRYDLSKPVFCKDPKISLLLTKPYINAMYANWDSYQGLPAVKSKLEMQLIDPYGKPISPELIWEQLPDKEITLENFRSLPQDQQILFLMNLSAQADSCNVNPLTIKKRTKQGAYQLPDLEPNRLYTALFNAVYQPEGKAEQKQEVHKFSFKTSRFATFEKQAGSFVLNATENQQQYAMYPVGVAFTNVQITQTLRTLIDDNVANDPVEVLNYAVKFDRLVYGGLSLKNMERVEHSVINLIMNANPDDANDRRILGILIRNPEPFNDPKMPVELLSDTVKLSLTLADLTVQGPEQFVYIHSRDTASVFITNAAMNLPVGNMQLSFRHKVFNGNDFHTIHEDYTSPLIPVSIPV